MRPSPSRPTGCRRSALWRPSDAGLMSPKSPRDRCSGGSRAIASLGPSPLSVEAVRLILQMRAEDAGFRGEALARITPHSLRSGCITNLAKASVHERDIMKHSKHGSAAVMRGYVRSSLAPEAFTSETLWDRLFDQDG